MKLVFEYIRETEGQLGIDNPQTQAPLKTRQRTKTYKQ